MKGVLLSARSRHRRLLRWVALLLLFAQGVAVGLAPTAEAYASRSAPAHVEEGGTHLHWSHNPDDCPACIALQLVAIPTRGPAPLPRVVIRHRPPATLRTTIARAERAGPPTSRAPPADDVAAG